MIAWLIIDKHKKEAPRKIRTAMYVKIDDYMALL